MFARWKTALKKEVARVWELLHLIQTMNEQAMRWATKHKDLTGRLAILKRVYEAASKQWPITSSLTRTGVYKQ